MAEKNQEEGGEQGTEREQNRVPKGRREELPVATSGNEFVYTLRVQVETPTKSSKATAELKHIISEEFFAGAEKHVGIQKKEKTK